MSKKKSPNVMYPPRVHDSKLEVKVIGDSEVQGNNIVANLDAVQDLGWEEHITFTWRAKDKDGWYFTVATKRLSDLRPGDEIMINSHRVKKLVVQ
jgi:hypothetical protein